MGERGAWKGSDEWEREVQRRKAVWDGRNVGPKGTLTQEKWTERLWKESAAWLWRVAWVWSAGRLSLDLFRRVVGWRADWRTARYVRAVSDWEVSRWIGDSPVLSPLQCSSI